MKAKHHHRHHEMKHHEQREMHKSHHRKLKASEHHSHPSHMESHAEHLEHVGTVKDSHQEGISRVILKKGEKEVGQHGSQSGGWIHHRSHE